MTRLAEATHADTLEVRDACLCLHVQRGARALARRFDEALRPVGLTHGQFSLMMSLNRPEPPSLGEVADLLGMDRTSLTAKLKALERDKLVRSVSDANDKRARRLALTAKGRALLAKALPIWRATHAELNDVVALVDQVKIRAAMNALNADL